LEFEAVCNRVPVGQKEVSTKEKARCRWTSRASIPHMQSIGFWVEGRQPRIERGTAGNCRGFLFSVPLTIRK
jgi:hypothetical protein